MQLIVLLQMGGTLPGGLWAIAILAYRINA